MLESKIDGIHGMADRISKSQVAVDLTRRCIKRSIIAQDKTGVYIAHHSAFSDSDLSEHPWISVPLLTAIRSVTEQAAIQPWTAASS
ncbi:hypothetical protein C1M53_28700 [Mesorhizobium sp. Pch-S]|nr:hypothetical protein C1M53_28700 [Mesorhizobium sp. Pch-S]